MGKKVAAGMLDEEPERLVFYKEDIEIITKTLSTFLNNARALCVLLVDKEGHLVAKEGADSSYDADTISMLVANSFTSTQQSARILGKLGFSVTFHQVERENIQFSLVGKRTILAVIFARTADAEMVRLYANQVSVKLTELFIDIANRRRKGPDSMGDSGGSLSPN